MLARRGSCEQARIVAIRNEKVRGSNPLSSTRTPGHWAGPGSSLRRTEWQLGSSSPFLPLSPPALGRARPVSGRLAYLSGLETTNVQRDVIEQSLCISELVARLRVSVQTIYDLRSQGRGPRSFRVGRELQFRVSEVDSWLRPDGGG